jgi:hypothetical protein
MKNIRATKGTSLMQIFLMVDRSTVVDTAKSTVTPGVIGLGRKAEMEGRAVADELAGGPLAGVRGEPCWCGVEKSRGDLSTGQLVDQFTTRTAEGAQHVDRSTTSVDLGYRLLRDVSTCRGRT